MTIRNVLLVLLLGSLTACQNMTPTPETRYVSTYCLIYKPILWSHKDTYETIQQVRKANATYDEVCRK